MTVRFAVEPVRPLGRAWLAVILVLDIAGIVVGAPSGIGLVWFIPSAGVGTFVVFRRPRISIGWLLLALAWDHVLQTVTLGATVAQFADGTIAMPTQFAAWLLGASGSALFVLYATLMLVFPTGRLPRNRWGNLARAGIGIGTGLTIAAAFSPTINVTLTEYPNGAFIRNPFPIAPHLPIWQFLNPDAVFPPILLLMAASAVSVVVRFRRAVGVERQQLRWMGAAVMLVMLGVVGGVVVSNLIPSLGESGAAWIVAIVAFPAIPISIGIAIFRYRLYEIDRIISRTISWALTTGVIGALFAGLVVGLQTLLAPITSESSLAVAGSTLAAAAAFQPARRRIQATVDHRFSRSRYNAERIVAAYAAHLRGVTDLEEIGDGVVDAIARSLGPNGARVWIRSSGGMGGTAA